MGEEEKGSRRGDPASRTGYKHRFVGRDQGWMAGRRRRALSFEKYVACLYFVCKLDFFLISLYAVMLGFDLTHFPFKIFFFSKSLFELHLGCF